MDASSLLGTAVVAVLVVMSGLALVRRRRQLEDRERRLEERERELLDRRAAILDVLSHELRTPLFVIAGGLETLSSGRVPAIEESQQLAAAVRRAAMRIERQVAAVLAATDRMFDAPQAESVSARTLLEAVRGRFDPAEAERIVVASEPGDLRLDVDPRYVQLMLLELVDNALKFGGDHGPVEVRAVAHGPTVCFEVSDTGRATAVDQRWFHPFHQDEHATTREHAGLGLGLTGATRLARRLGGDVRIDTRPTGGVTAVVELPRAVRLGDVHGVAG